MSTTNTRSTRTNKSNSVLTARFKHIRLNALHKLLKKYGLKSPSLAKDILSAVQEPDMRISYSKYESMFHSIKSKSTQLTWDIQPGQALKLCDIPLKITNNFFKLTDRHKQGERYTQYSVEPVLQEMLNKSYKTAIIGSQLPVCAPEGSDFCIELDNFLTLEQKEQNKLNKALKGVHKSCLVFGVGAKGLYRKFSIFTEISGKDADKKHPFRLNTRDMTEFKYSYDISAGIQSIMLNFCNNYSDVDTKKLFPVLTEYTTNKKQARAEIAKINNQSIPDLKEHIIILSYGGLKKERNFGSLPVITQEFYNEQEAMNSIVRANVHKIDDLEFQTYLTEKLSNKSDTKSDNFIIYAVMEYYEKLVRDIIIKLRPTKSRYQEVHDCVYCTEPIQEQLIISTIQQELNFNLLID